MLKIVTAEEMQRIDRTTIKKYGIAGSILMERAGLAVVEKINELFFQPTVRSSQFTEEKKLPTVNRQPSTVYVLCGGGNNGGDGFVIARVLHNQKRNVEVFLAVNPGNLRGDAKINYNAAVKFGVKIYPIKRFLTGHRSLVTGHCLIVDALLGTGLSKDVRKPLSTLIERMNRTKCTIFSVDIPSGISSDTGQIMGCAVKASHTVTFGLPKRGHLLYPGAEYTGNLSVADIGFPRALIESKKIKINMLQNNDVSSLLPERPPYSHKGTYGHVLFVAGSRGKTGAALMAAKSCLRSGAGLVTIGLPETLVNTFQSRVTEEMILPLPDKGNGTFSHKADIAILNFLKTKADVLAIGPGISVDREISKLVEHIVIASRVPVVIDADGLNAIATNKALFKKTCAPIILTPHPGEMSQLLSGKQVTVGTSRYDCCNDTRSRGDIKQIERDRISSALTYSRKNKVYCVLKGVPTVTAFPDGQAFVNPTGNPGMATAGTGDVLTGIIASFLAQKLTPQSASILGVYIHGLLGDVVAKKKGKHSLIASDIINAIPNVFQSLIL
jgi:NAD(P)H-hydrate epimerase